MPHPVEPRPVDIGRYVGYMTTVMQLRQAREQFEFAKQRAAEQSALDWMRMQNARTALEIQQANLALRQRELGQRQAEFQAEAPQRKAQLQYTQAQTAKTQEAIENEQEMDALRPVPEDLLDYIHRVGGAVESNYERQYPALPGARGAHTLVHRARKEDIIKALDERHRDKQLALREGAAEEKGPALTALQNAQSYFGQYAAAARPKVMEHLGEFDAAHPEEFHRRVLDAAQWYMDNYTRNATAAGVDMIPDAFKEYIEEIRTLYPAYYGWVRQQSGAKDPMTVLAETIAARVANE